MAAVPGRMALFTLSSLAAGLAGSGTVFIASRAVQGVGAALLMPTTLAIIMATFTNARQRKYGHRHPGRGRRAGIALAELTTGDEQAGEFITE